MIIDDEPENLNVLEGMLRQRGWAVRAFPRGEMALAAAHRDPPVLILLDIRMPGMDGYEVCRRFKADDALRRIPIIFLSAFAENSVKEKAFEAGGADYVTKPFAAVEVFARVGSQLALARQQAQLDELVGQRVRELGEAHQRVLSWERAKNDWLHALSREMRAPLGGVFAIAESLFGELTSESSCHELAVAFENSRQRLEKLVADALALAQIDVAAEDFALSSVPLAELVRESVAAVPDLLSDADLNTALAPLGGVRVSGEPLLLGRALVELMRAIAHCEEIWEPVALASRACDGRAHVTITSGGKSPPPAAVDTFPEVGGQRTALNDGDDPGLGGALARRAIRLFGGSVTIAIGPDQGIVIEVSLPVA
jgi:CheY-like chemotaxis protein